MCNVSRDRPPVVRQINRKAEVPVGARLMGWGSPWSVERVRLRGAGGTGFRGFCFWCFGGLDVLALEPRVKLQTRFCSGNRCGNGGGRGQLYDLYICLTVPAKHTAGQGRGWDASPQAHHDTVIFTCKPLMAVRLSKPNALVSYALARIASPKRTRRECPMALGCPRGSGQHYVPP